jgi:hypothetical protein
VSRAGDEVEFVSVVAVSPRSRYMECKDADSEQEREAMS